MGKKEDNRLWRLKLDYERASRVGLCRRRVD